MIEQVPIEEYDRLRRGTPEVHMFSASDFADVEAPARHFHVEGLVPGHTVTTLNGDGGTGKSLLALQLAVATVTAGRWCGLHVATGPVVYLSAEDDEAELHRRLEDIARHQNISLSELGALHIIALAGEDALLATPEKGNVLKPTKLFHAVEAALARQKPALVIIDTLADVFGGDENDRAQARQFVGLIRGWAIRYKCAVLLLAHPSMSGMSSGTGTSGSTAWNNSVRSRLYLDRVKSNDFEADPDARVLRTVKANYGRTGGEVRMRWQDGVFVTPVDTLPTALGALAEANRADRIFLELLARFDAEGRYVSAHGTANNYAPTAFARHPNADGIIKRGFQAAMDRLFLANRIEIGQSTDGPPSKRKEIIKVAQVERRADQ